MTRTTAGKAHVSALTTAAAVIAAVLGFGEMPGEGELAQALGVLALTAASAAASWLATYYKNNYPK